MGLIFGGVVPKVLPLFGGDIMLRRDVALLLPMLIVDIVDMVGTVVDVDGDTDSPPKGPVLLRAV